MSTTNNSALNRHFKNQKPTSAHLIYLDKILKDIDPIHMEKILEIRKNIELTILNNTKSENEVVSYLSWVSDKLKFINRKRWKLVKKEVEKVYA